MRQCTKSMRWGKCWTASGPPCDRCAPRPLHRSTACPPAVRTKTRSMQPLAHVRLMAHYATCQSAPAGGWRIARARPPPCAAICCSTPLSPFRPGARRPRLRRYVTASSVVVWPCESNLGDRMACSARTRSPHHSAHTQLPPRALCCAALLDASSPPLSACCGAQYELQRDVPSAAGQ